MKITKLHIIIWFVIAICWTFISRFMNIYWQTLTIQPKLNVVILHTIATPLAFIAWVAVILMSIFWWDRKENK